ncbi:MAG: hypothetical protein IT464_08240 [Planctomycetes bacterium]|nr:hypothetical protein [Planctomycetota bacterium]
MKYAICTLLLALLVGCASAEQYFRLEEWGEGWKLFVEEKDGEAFRASWVEGDNTSLKLVNYHSAGSGGDFTVINTLYLEVDKTGKIVQGRLKRVTTVGFDEARAREQGAQWFRVLQGNALVGKDARGTLNVRCEGGFDFAGTIEPMDGLEIKRPE